MPTRIVLDSTAIAALFFKDPFSEKIAKTITNYEEFHTLDFAYAEIGNVAWKRVHIFREDRDGVMRSLDMSSKFIEDNCDVIPSNKHLQDALRIALDNEITVYDALFLAVVKHFKTTLLTTDEKLYRKVKESKKIADLLTLPST